MPPREKKQTPNFEKSSNQSPKAKPEMSATLLLLLRGARLQDVPYEFSGS